MLVVRPATPADAEAGSLVLRRSIVELCQADHSGDPASIARWTANKTPEAWRGWLARSDAHLLVAERGGRLVGVGMVDAAGEVQLNDVSPGARHQGVSTALLGAMEEACRRRGLPACTLHSTRTAERFYARRGYAPRGDGSGLLVKRLLQAAPGAGRAGGRRVRIA